MSESPFLSPGELSAILKTSLKWCYQRLNAGDIPGARKVNGVWFIHRETFLAGFIKSTPKEARRPVGRHGL